MSEREADLATNIQQLEAMLADVEALPDASLREQVRRMIQTLLEFHAEGLAKIVERLQSEGDSARSLLESLTDDEVVGSLLLLYDLHPMESATDVAGDSSLRLQTRIELPLVPANPHTNVHR